MTLEGLSPAELTAKLFEEFISQGWRIEEQEVIAERDGLLDVRLKLEREEGAAGDGP